jgi:hypothetical protein
MSRIDMLPADQRAVLQLLLRQGRSYRDLSDLLGLDEAAVRRRAHDAVAALAPPGAGDLPPERRDQIADYLLGQDGEQQRTVTYDFLDASAGGRAWARAVAGELRAVAAGGLPEVPGDDEEARPRRSRRRGAIVLAALAVAAVAAVVALLVTRGGDSGGDGGTVAPAAATTASGSQPQVEAQANLVPPAGRKGLKALGIVLVQRTQGRHQIVAAVQGLPRPKRGGYGIWLYSGPGKAQWLGFFASRDRHGRLLARGEIKATIGDYREVLVTREAHGNPLRPGTIFLRGPVQTADDTGG